MGQSKVSQQRLEAQAKRAEALTLRRAGASYDKIAAALGISTKNAYKHVMKGLAALKKMNDELAEQVRQLELQRLDEMQTALYAAALSPVPQTALDREGKPVIVDSGRDQQLRVIDRVIKIMERRDALMGVNAPTKVEQSGPNGEPIKTETHDRQPFDISKLSLEELKQYRVIVEKAKNGGSSGGAPPAPPPVP
jgi:hypothetical protein